MSLIIKVRFAQCVGDAFTDKPTGRNLYATEAKYLASIHVHKEYFLPIP